MDTGVALAVGTRLIGQVGDAEDDVWLASFRIEAWEGLRTQHCHFQLRVLVLYFRGQPKVQGLH